MLKWHESNLTFDCASNKKTGKSSVKTFAIFCSVVEGIFNGVANNTNQERATDICVLEKWASQHWNALVFFHAHIFV